VKLEGSITTFPLRELVDMVMYSSVTGVLELYTQGGPGSLFFRDGHPYHATFGLKQGIEATRLLFADTNARFLFAADITVDAETLWMDPLDLFDSCEAMAQRLVKTRDVVPGLDWVPVTVRDHQTQVSIAEDDWPMLAAIDGQRSVDDIAAEIACDVVDVCESLQRLAERGLVRMQKPASRRLDLGSPLILPGQQAAPVQERRSLFERLIEALPEQELAPLQPTAEPKPAPQRSADDDPILKLLRGSP